MLTPDLLLVLVLLVLVLPLLAQLPLPKATGNIVSTQCFVCYVCMLSWHLIVACWGFVSELYRKANRILLQIWQLIPFPSAYFDPLDLSNL